MEWATFVQGVLGRTFDCYFFRQGSAMTDQMVRPNFHSDATGGNGPWHGYHNPEVNDIIDTARTVMDREERDAMYQRLNKIIREEAPWVPMGQSFWGPCTWTADPWCGDGPAGPSPASPPGGHCQ